MKISKVLFISVLFLTLIVSSEISSIQGRQLRPMLNINHDLKNIMKEANNRRKILSKISSEQGMINFNNINSNTVGESKQASSVQPTHPGPSDHKLGMKDSKAEQHKNDAFRPTTPGNSPGGGHAFELISSPYGNRGHFVTTTEAPTDDFRATNNPGNSTGAFEQTSSPDDNKRNFVPFDDKDGYRPTTPGNSPGAGHAYEQITIPNAYESKFATSEGGGRGGGGHNLGNNN